MIRRVATQAIGKALSQVARQVTKGEAKNLPDALRIVKKELDNLEFKDFRKFAHSKEAFKASAYMISKGGQRALQNFVRGKTNIRYSPALVTGMVAYLGWEASCGLVKDYQEGKLPAPAEEASVTTDDLGCGSNVVLFDERLRLQLAKKIATVFGDSINSVLKEENSEKGDPLSPVGASGHGALFHLNQLAYYQLKHRAGGKPVKGIEMARRVAFFDDEFEIPDQNVPLVCGTSKHCISQRLRYVDIVLGTRGIDTAALAEPEEWIELKSYAAQSTGTDSKRYKLIEELKRGDFKRWDFLRANRGSSMHKQYNIDRAATNLRSAWLTKAEAKEAVVRKRQAISPNFQWRFQAFKSTYKNNTSKVEVSPFLGSTNKKDSLRWLFAVRPKGKDSGKEKEFIDTSFGTGSSNVNNAKLVSGGTIISDLIALGFDDVLQAAVETTVAVD